MKIDRKNASHETSGETGLKRISICSLNHSPRKSKIDKIKYIVTLFPLLQIQVKGLRTHVIFSLRIINDKVIIKVIIAGEAHAGVRQPGYLRKDLPPAGDSLPGEDRRGEDPDRLVQLRGQGGRQHPGVPEKAGSNPTDNRQEHRMQKIQGIHIYFYPTPAIVNLSN